MNHRGFEHNILNTVLNIAVILLPFCLIFFLALILINNLDIRILQFLHQALTVIPILWPVQSCVHVRCCGGSFSRLIISLSGSSCPPAALSFPSLLLLATLNDGLQRPPLLTRASAPPCDVRAALHVRTILRRAAAAFSPFQKKHRV